MNKYVLNHSCIHDNRKLPFEYYSFMKIVSNNLQFSPFIEHCLDTRFRQLRSRGHNMFIRNRYEDVIIALAKFCYETEFEDKMLDIHPFTDDLYGEDANKHNTSIHSLYLEFYDVFDMMASGDSIANTIWESSV